MAEPIPSANSAVIPTTKDSPLTDIATSPPMSELVFDTKTNGKTRKDSYESSELSDLADDDSEAETDKMDFLDDDNPDTTTQVSDLQALSQLTELARLKGVDSDLDDEKVKEEEEIEEVEENGNEEEEIEENEEHENEENDEENGDVEEENRSIENHDTLDEDHPESLDNELDTSLSINPKENKEAQEEIARDIDGITSGVTGKKRSVSSETSGHSRKRSLSTDLSHKKKKLKTEDDSEEHDENEQEADDEDVEDETAVGENQDVPKVVVEEVPTEDVDMDEQHKLAIDELITIERDFAVLRDKLYQDKLSLLEHELQLCLEGSHPELLKIYYKINEFYQDNVKLANANLNYSLKCINTETVACRTSIHQDFLKKLMDTKSEMITDTTSLWYKINKERNQLDQIVPDYNYSAIPTIPNVTVANFEETLQNGHMDIPLSKKAIKQNTLVELVQQRNNVNHQLGILNGLMEFHGFPSTLSVDGSVQEFLLRKASKEEVDEDLQAMGII